MPNAPEEQVASSHSNKKPHFFPWGSIGIVCAGLGIAVMLIVASLAYCRLFNINIFLAKKIDGLHHQLEQTQTSLIDMQKTTLEAQQAVQQVQNTLENQKQLLSQISHPPRSDKDEWEMTKAYHYVKLAHDHLQFDQDVRLAITLLQAADQTLRPLTDPKLADIRKALANDITSLQSVPALDTAGIYLRLSALNEQVDKLPVSNKLLPAETPPPSTTKNEPSTAGWKRGLQTSWQALQQIIVVRHHSSTVLPLVTPDQHIFLYQNLHAFLLQSMWALLHKQATIYHSSLQQSIEWIKQYFATDSPVAQSMLTNFYQLEQINISPQIPSITNSLHEFQNYLGQSTK